MLYQNVLNQQGGLTITFMSTFILQIRVMIFIYYQLIRLFLY